MIHHVCSCDKCIFHRMNDDSDDDDDDDVIYQVETCFFCFFFYSLFNTGSFDNRKYIS